MSPNKASNYDVTMRDANNNNFFFTYKKSGQHPIQIKQEEQDFFHNSDDESVHILKEGGTYGFPICVHDDSDESNESGSSPAYSPTSPAYSPTSPVHSPISPTPAKHDGKWIDASTSIPPEYYINDYNNLVTVLHPGLTSTTMLIQIIKNDGKHEQGMSHHFVIIGTTSQHLVNFATDMIVHSRETVNPGPKWVTNFENFQLVVMVIEKFCFQPE
jgi:hypothetical protein